MQEFREKKIVNCSMTKELSINEIKDYKKDSKYLIERGSFLVSTLIIEAGCFYFIFLISIHWLVKAAFLLLAVLYLYGLIRDVVTEYKIMKSDVKVVFSEGVFITLQRGLKRNCVVEYNEFGNTRKKVIEEPVLIGTKIETGDLVSIIVEPNYTYIMKSIK